MQTHECHAESLLNDYIYLSIYLFTKLLSVLLLLYPNVMTSFFYPVGDWETKVSPWITAGDRVQLALPPSHLWGGRLLEKDFQEDPGPSLHLSPGDRKSTRLNSSHL